MKDSQVHKISIAYVDSLNPNSEGAKKRKSFYQELGLGIFASFVLGLVTILSYHWFYRAQFHIQTNNAMIEGDVFQVQSRMMGYTAKVFVSEGEAVKKGQVLLALDMTDIEVEKGMKAARLRKAQADFKRGEILHRSQMISKSDFEMLEASLAMASADHEASLLKEKYTKIVAPEDGVLAKVNIKQGQFIQPGQNLFALVSQRKFWVKANYKETQLGKIKVGYPAEVTVDAYPDTKLLGRVRGILPSSGSILSLLPPENATGNFTKVVQRVSVLIDLETTEIQLKPGLSAVATVHADESEK